MQRLEAGVDKLANTVRVTLGPKGRNVALINLTESADHQRWCDHRKRDRAGGCIREHGCTAGKEVATKTNDVAGDGTTTATVLAQAMIGAGMSNPRQGCKTGSF